MANGFLRRMGTIVTGRRGKDERQITLEEAISTVEAAEGTDMFGGIRVTRRYLADGSGHLWKGDGLWILIDDVSLTPSGAAAFLRSLFTPNDGRAALIYAYGTHVVDRHDADFHKIKIGISWGSEPVIAGGNLGISEKVMLDYLTPRLNQPQAF